MAVILKRGKAYQVTYEVLTSNNRVKTIKENFTNYQDALEKKELIDGEIDTRFTPDSLFTDVIKDWLSDSYFMSHITKHRESYKNFELYLQDILKTQKFVTLIVPLLKKFLIKSVQLKVQKDQILCLLKQFVVANYYFLKLAITLWN